MTNRKGRGHLRKIVLVLPGLVLASFVVNTAWGILAESRRFADVVAMGRISDNKGGLSRESLSDVMAQVRAIETERICRSDIVKAGLRLVLADIDAAGAENASDEGKARLEFAENYIRHALSCQPADGDIWLRLAMIRWLRDGSDMEVATLMNISQGYGPSDANLIRGRFVMWRQFAKGTLNEAERARDADIAVVCSDEGEILRWTLHDVCPKAASGPKRAMPL